MSLQSLVDDHGLILGHGSIMMFPNEYQYFSFLATSVPEMESMRRFLSKIEVHVLNQSNWYPLALAKSPESAYDQLSYKLAAIPDVLDGLIPHAIVMAGVRIDKTREDLRTTMVVVDDILEWR